MSRSLDGKIAVVTGSGRGIGLGIAKSLAERGATIVISDISEENAKNGVAQIEAIGGKAIAVVANVADFESAQNLMDETIRQLGCIDILVNNAGINRDCMMHKMGSDDWNAVIGVNLTGVFHCMRAVINHMREREYGRIISISSASYINGNIGQANYAAAKAGVVALSKTCAKENGKKNITSNVIVPGFIDTEMTRGVPEKAWDIMVSKISMGRAGTPTDIGNMVAFLASDEAAYVTQGVFEVGGGMVL